MALAEPADPTSGTTQPSRTPRGTAVGRIEVTDLTAAYRGRPAITGVNLAMEPGKVTAHIGPSGCGKSTLLRCLNGLHMTVPGASVTGTVHLDGTNIYDRGVDLVQVRRHVGMVFQRPNPFPTMSIADNVAAGLKFGPRSDRRGPRRRE